MRIISKFHDYYDKSMGYGQDMSLVFVRNEADAVKAPPGMEPPHRFDGRSRLWDAWLTPFSIGFCGRIYRGITAYLRYTDYTAEVHHPDVAHCFYSLETLTEFLLTKGIKLAEETKQRRKWRRLWSSRADWRTFMERPQGSNDSESWFIENKVAVMVWDRALMIGNDSGIIINPMLKRYEFFRVFDPFQTYQELSMFVGGVLPGSEADMAVVSDKDRILQRGFDKWSFRKMPEAKR